MRRAAKFVARLLAGAAGLFLAGALFLTATGPGQQTLLGWASWTLSSEALTVETGELSGSLFGEGQLSYVTISDAGGVLAKLEQVRFAWSPFDLFEKRVTIEAVSAERAGLRRLPARQPSAADLTGGPAFGKPRWFTPEILPIPFAIDRLHITEAVVSEAVLGAPARLSIRGHVDARNPQDALGASLNMRDLDRASFATAEVEYRANDGELHVAASAEEKAGGVLSTLLDIENSRDLRLELKGDGVWARWRGDWQASVNDDRLAGGNLVFSGAKDKLSVEIDADGEIGRFLPAPYASVLAGKSSLDLKADYLGQQKIRLHTLALEAPHIRARADGVADFANYAISGNGQIRLRKGPEGEPVSIVLNNEKNLYIDSAEIVFDTLDGNAEPVLEAEVKAAGLSINGTSIESVSAKSRISHVDTHPRIRLSQFAVRHPRAQVRQQGTARLQKSGRTYSLEGLVLESGKGRLTADAIIDDTLAGKIMLSAMPLSLTEIFAPDLALGGTLDGQISFAGNTDEPQADYNLTFRGVSEPELIPLDSAKFDLSATGQLTAASLSVAAQASGPDGMAFNAEGVINDPGGTNKLDLTASGSAPIGLANSFLAKRGTRIEGKALVDLSLSGEANAPVIVGSVSAQDATINDPSTGISLVDTSVAARLFDGKLRVTKLNARSRKGGTVEASGTLDISAPGKQLPASFTLSAEDFKFSDGRIVAGQARSRLSLEGDLRDEVGLSGTVDIARLDVRIPQALPASVTALELKHENAPDHIEAAAGKPEEQEEDGLTTKVRLSLDVRSANRIFVTGRGLDAQLGGQLQLSGSADDPSAIGEFTLERGTMAVLGRSLDITSGTLDFSGNLDPRLNFEAVTEVDDTTITIAVTGNASEPQFGFSSQPELPEDEILALLLFNRSFSELTPAQLVQLAAQVSALGGLTGGAGVFEKLRSSLGVDRLDVTTTEEGELAVTAGSAVNDNIFVGVEQGTSGESSRVKIDLDVTENVKIRGEAGADGDSKLGVGFEWEY